MFAHNFRTFRFLIDDTFSIFFSFVFPLRPSLIRLLRHVRITSRRRSQTRRLRTAERFPFTTEYIVAHLFNYFCSFSANRLYGKHFLWRKA